MPNLEIFSSGIKPFVFRGLTGNGNLTGNFLAPYLAFVIPFSAARWRGHHGVHLFLSVTARIDHGRSRPDPRSVPASRP